MAAVSNIKSDAITAITSATKRLVESGLNRGSTITARGHILTTEAASSATSTWRMFRIPVDAYLSSLIYAIDAGGGSAAIDIGFYRPNGDGTITDVDLNALGTAIAVASAQVRTEILNETQDLNTIEEHAWELAGLSARPAYSEFEIVATVETVTANVVDFILIAQYAMPG